MAGQHLTQIRFESLDDTVSMHMARVNMNGTLQSSQRTLGFWTLPACKILLCHCCTVVVAIHSEMGCIRLYKSPFMVLSGFELSIPKLLATHRSP